jgi:hypothetical protein
MMFIAQNGSKWDDSLQSQMALESPAVDGPLVLPALLIETLHAAGAESAKRLLGGPLAFPWRFRAHGNDVCLVLILSIYVYIYTYIYIRIYTCVYNLYHMYILYVSPISSNTSNHKALCQNSRLKTYTRWPCQALEGPMV